MHNYIKPLVSVCMITYNHEQYIKQAIEGVLIQKSNFNYELIIGEDRSTDNTRNLIQEYKKDYPAIIKPILRKKNIGMIANLIDTINNCKGKYIATCEGDDYWTDPFKLQKQVDFLEANEYFSACFTNAQQINLKNHVERLFVNGLEEGYVPKKTVIIKGGGLYPTASLVFKRNQYNCEVYKNITELAGDELLIMALATKGNIYFINEVTCTYRNWGGGIFSSMKEDKRKICLLKENSIKGYKKFDTISNKEFHKFIQRKISLVSLFIIQNSTTWKRYRYILYLQPKEIFKLIKWNIKYCILKLNMVFK